MGPNAINDEVIWNFPGQPPSVKPFGGRLGYMANPPRPGSAQAVWIDQWRRESSPTAETMVALHAAAPSPAIAAEIAGLSAAAKNYLEDALQAHVQRGYGRCDEERSSLMPRRAVPF